VTSNVLVPEESSVSSASRLDLEDDSVLQRVSWVLDALGVKTPALVGLVVAVLEGHFSQVLVAVVVDSKAPLGVVPEVLAVSCVPSELLESLCDVGPDSCLSVDVVLVAFLVGDAVRSLQISSDSLSSVIEDEPLL